ncbi:ABC transporter ATP-binding protein [Rhodoligotrophos ferricapiens]|uniref:ABC transporter ATP-binding protein n=1 Tax=Rhodoligotrophos ferricapiens TaxID=3069264 RepID=UPI00315D2985
MADPIVALSDVRLTLPSRAGPVEILRGIDLVISPGEAIGLVGPSGSGKTTLLMVLAGLEPPSAGTVKVASRDLTGLGEDALAAFRRDNVGIVFQAFHLIPTMTALENVAVPLEFKGERNAFTLAAEQLKRVRLGHRLDHYPGQLSGGEQQRVAIARALATGAQLLLADEPTGNLDQETGAQIVDLLFSVQKEEKATLVLVTHDPALAERCSRVIHMADGRIIGERQPGRTPAETEVLA